MANIKNLKKQLKSTKSTLKITSAMKLVSAAKMNRFQDQLHRSESYAREIEKLVYECYSAGDTTTHPMLTKDKNNHKHVLVLSSDRGLCGSYNQQIASVVREFVRENKEDVRLSFWGTKARDILKFSNIGKTYHHTAGEDFSNIVKNIAGDFMNEFLNKEIGEVYVAYNAYKGAGTYRPIIKKILPFEVEKKLEDNIGVDYKYEPDREQVLNYVLPEAFVSIFHSCFLNAEATQHAARMIAMDNAAKNCKEAIRNLTLKINKRRQASITKELIEIVSGAESL